MVRRRSVMSALLALTLLDACGGESTGARGVSGAHDASTPSVARRRRDDRPQLLLVRREGDPLPAVAFASAHDFGPLASVALSSALAARLRAQSFVVQARPNALGFTLSARVAHAAEARRFVEAVGAALAAPLEANDPALPGVRAAVTAAAGAKAAGPAEAAVAACSGDLLLPDSARGWDPGSKSGLEELRAWQAQAESIQGGAFAAVGPRDVLSAVEAGLERLRTWDEGTALADGWPARSELGTDFTPNASHRLALAWRLGSVDAAADGVDTLVAPEGSLARRLAALRPAWRIERALAVARPRGACLRVDAVPLHPEVAPAAADVARAAALVSDELAQATQSGAKGSLDDAITSTSDPGAAAAAAAWRGLVGHLEPGPARSAIAYTASSAEKGRFDFGAALTAQRAAAQQPLMEVVERAEPGQGRLFALLAPACGTGAESTNDAGEAAFVVSALAAAAPPGEVTVEPWIATDGVGLLVGTKRASTTESGDAQARRLGRALGELIAARRPSPAVLVGTRDELAAAVGGEQHRGYFAALDALTGGHPSWLEPRGTFGALATAPVGGFDAALGRWLARPLRLAVLTNGAPSQAEHVRVEAERWLRPTRGEPARCPTRSRPPVAATELTLSVSGDAPEGSYLGVPFPTFDHRLPSEARATLLLLNRSGGWLDQALTDLPASASALAVGGPDHAALVVQVVAEEGQRAAAVERLRALFERMASGRLAAGEAELARREIEQSDTAELLDPRRRAIATWRNPKNPSEPPLDAARLGKWLMTLRRSGMVLVNVAPRR